MKKSILPVVAAIAGGMLLFASAALAQVPSSAEPSRVQQQIPSVDSQLGVPSGPVGGVTGGQVIEAPAGSEKVTFVLKELVIEGMTAYSEKDVAPLYREKIGQTISLADVYGIAQQLTVKYRNDGYVLTQVVVPEQTIDGGRVRLRVVEGFVDDVRIEGQTRGSLEFLQGFARKIREQRPLNAKSLERYILLMNDLPGVNARAILSPSATTQGATDIVIVVDQKALDAFGQVDNRGTRYLGPMQMNVGTRLNSPLGFYEGISLQAATAFSDLTDPEMKHFAAGWAQPLNHEGTRLSVGSSVTSTDPGYTLSAFDIRGMARAVNVELFHPFIRTRNDNLSGVLRFNYLNSERSDNLGLGDTIDRLRVLRAAGTYQFTDRLVGLNTFNAEISKGIDVLNASQKGDANMTRASGDPQFFKSTLEASRLQRLSPMFDAYVSVAGQHTNDLLLASEEFGVGGTNYGSAYDPSEITGEKGVAARAELRANNPIRLPVNMLQTYGFYDVGKVWDEDATLVQDRQRSLASAGLGLRSTVNDNLAATFEVAVPLTRDVGTEGDRGTRLFGTITGRF